MTVYGARTIKKRSRRTKMEMEALREALFEIVAENQPVTVRGAFYLATCRGVIPKTENEGYRPVQRGCSRCAAKASYLDTGSPTALGLGSAIGATAGHR
jgi:hypothetical protein